MQNSNFTAHDVRNGLCIYNGSSQSAMIVSLIEYAEYHHHLTFGRITEEDIFRMRSKPLARLGIKITQEGRGMGAAV